MNKYSSNLAVMSETGRLPMYFSVIISIVKYMYLYRLENISEGLFTDSYMSSKHLHHEGLQSWYNVHSSVVRSENFFLYKSYVKPFGEYCKKKINQKLHILLESRTGQTYEFRKT